MSQLADESFIRYEKEFDNVQDVFELQVAFPMSPATTIEAEKSDRSFSHSATSTTHSPTTWFPLHPSSQQLSKLQEESTTSPQLCGFSKVDCHHCAPIYHNPRSVMLICWQKASKPR